MKKTSKNRIRDHVEEKYRAKMYRVWKQTFAKGLPLLVLLLGCTLLFCPDNARGTVWEANSIETIRTKLKAGQNSYTFEEGDTFYNIGLAVNVKWQTLMALNGFEEGSQYTVPVGTTITFDGSKITVTDQNGSVISEKELGEEDKLDPSEPFANQPSDTDKQAAQVSGTENKTTTAKRAVQTTGINEQAKQTEAPIDKKQAENEKQAVEAAKEQAEKEKAAAEKERQEAERLKQEAEQKLTEVLNKENSLSYAELQAKQAAATAKVTEAQANYDGLAAQLTGVEQKVLAATTAQQAAQVALTTAQGTISQATTNYGNAQQRVTEVSGQISVLQSQAGEDANIQAQLAQLQQQLSTAQGELDTFGSQLAAAQQAATEAQAAYEAAATALNAAITEKAAIEAAIGQAQTILVAAQQELANLPSLSTAATSDEAKKIQAELVQYTNWITALDQQITDLASKIQTLNERIVELDLLIKGITTEAHKVEADGKEANNSAAEANQNADKASETADEVENNLPHIPTNEDKFVTVLIDETGNVLTDTEGYVKVSESDPVKTVETLANGDTITTYTTTVTYHKIVNTDEEVTINIDEAGNVLTSLEGYFKISESGPIKTVETLTNGDTITTYTTTVTYHKIVNTDKEVTINIDEAGNVLTSLEGYFKIHESEPVKTIEILVNGDTITTYTTTVTYHKIQNENKFVTKNVDEAGIELTDLTGYERVSESEPVKSVETLANGDTITTYTTTITYKKVSTKDPIIEAIKPANDPVIKSIREQVETEDTRVTLDQADQLVNAVFSKEVAKYFEKLVQEEQERYGETKISNTKDEAAYREIAERAVEVMYKFSHTRPTNQASEGTYVVDREVGSEKMGFWSENISQTSVGKSEVNGDSTLLAQLIAQRMFNQYIDSEREAGRAGDYVNGGHYMNIIQSGHSDMVLAVFIVEDGENPDSYRIATTVSTGFISIVK